MKKIKLDLSNLNEVFPDDFSQEQIAKAKTLFLKKMPILLREKSLSWLIMELSLVNIS